MSATSTEVPPEPGMGDRARDGAPDGLDDDSDREELRQRYYGLMQELRVILPGVQVLVGFLLTVPFAQRFPELDGAGTTLFGIALISSMLSVVAFVAPAALHRVGDRTARALRLEVSITLTRVGLALLAVALVSSLIVVSRLVFSGVVATLLAVVAGLAMVGLWLVLPLATRTSSGRAGGPAR